MAERTFVPIKDYGGNEADIMSYKIDFPLTPKFVQQVGTGIGAVTKFSSASMLIEKASGVNILAKDSYTDGLIIGGSRYVVIVPRFRDPISESEVIGTGDGMTTDFPFDLTGLPIIPNSMEVQYTNSGSDYYGNDEYVEDDRGEFTGDAAGEVHYMSGSGTVTCMNPPDNGTDVIMSYLRFGTDPAATNLVVAPYLYHYNDEPSPPERILLGNLGDITLQVEQFQNYIRDAESVNFRLFADITPGGSESNSTDWMWAGQPYVLENLRGATRLMLAVKQFNKAASGATYCLYAFGV